MPRRSAASEAEIHSAGMDTSPFPGPGHAGFPRGLATAAGHPTLTSINVDEPVHYQPIIKLTIRVRLEPRRACMAQVHFLDVTNRDGVQTARTGLSKFRKTMVKFYLAKLGVAQSEIGFPFLFHEKPYVLANVALARAGAFGDLRLSGWCRAITAPADQPVPPRLRPPNRPISTSTQI